MSNRWQWPHVGRWCATTSLTRIGDAIRQTAPEKAASLACATPPSPPAAYITVRYALFAPATHRTDVFRSACREEKKWMPLPRRASDAFEYGAPQIALLRDTLWHFYGPCRRALEREKFSSCLRVPTLCVDSSCKSRECRYLFSFLRHEGGHTRRGDLVECGNRFVVGIPASCIKAALQSLDCGINVLENKIIFIRQYLRSVIG